MDALSLAAFAPGDASARVRQTSELFTPTLQGGVGNTRLNVMGIGLIIGALLLLEKVRP